MPRPRSIGSAAAIIALLVGLSDQAIAYEVEADSNANTVYVLLWNHNAGAAYDSISIGEALPGFVSQATATIVPASVAPSGSDLAAIEFDVAAAAILGSTGDLTITASGTASDQPIDVVLTVPLEVVVSAPAAQGLVGQGIPAPDPGGADTDGDGVSDALEIAFGSDPSDPLSVPGSASAAVPALQALGLTCLAALLVLSTTRLARRRQQNRSRR
ncbi:MAG: hypothetical protein GY772_03610 [bacterium]|nr:hypothetical protein [bacterium]